LFVTSSSFPEGAPLTRLKLLSTTLLPAATKVDNDTLRYYIEGAFNPASRMVMGGNNKISGAI